MRAGAAAIAKAAGTTLWARAKDQWMARTDWSPEAMSVLFGCHSPVFNGHSHIDPASFDFTAYGCR